MPALPLDKAGPYVAAAYLVFLLLLLVYVWIMGLKLGRIERETAELNAIVAQRAKAESQRAIEQEHLVEDAEESLV
jgi:hypothetical protein